MRIKCVVTCGAARAGWPVRPGGRTDARASTTGRCWRSIPGMHTAPIRRADVDRGRPHRGDRRRRTRRCGSGRWRTAAAAHDPSADRAGRRRQDLCGGDQPGRDDDRGGRLDLLVGDGSAGAGLPLRPRHRRHDRPPRRTAGRRPLPRFLAGRDAAGGGARRREWHAALCPDATARWSELAADDATTATRATAPPSPPTAGWRPRAMTAACGSTTPTAKLLHSVATPHARPFGLAFNPVDGRLAVGFEDTTEVRLFDGATLAAAAGTRSPRDRQRRSLEGRLVGGWGGAVRRGQIREGWRQSDDCLGGRRGRDAPDAAGGRRHGNEPAATARRRRCW